MVPESSIRRAGGRRNVGDNIGRHSDDRAGEQVVGNFTVYSYPQGASFAFLAYGVLLLAAILWAWWVWKKGGRRDEGTDLDRGADVEMAV